MFSTRHILGMALVFLASFCLTFVGCGGGGGGGGTTGGGTTGGGAMGLGPSGTTCTTPTACSSQPAGTQAMSCPASTGASPAVTPADADYVFTSLNTIRNNLGLPPFTRTAALDQFATNASTALMNTGTPHGHFSANAGTDPAFMGGRAENQTSPTGWSPNTTSIEIDEIIACFMSEENDPAGFQKGHWESIVCPCYIRIGVGLVKNGAGNLFMSIEFSQ